MQQTNKSTKRPSKVRPTEAARAAKPVLQTLSEAELMKVRGGAGATPPPGHGQYATAIE
jgi:hypothetical protein